MKWNIISDSSIDLFEPENKPENVDFFTVPFTINVDGVDYVDDEDLDTSVLLEAMKATKKGSSSACPSPGAWHELFSREGNVIALTITSGLSGSYNSAMAARAMVHEEEPEKNIEVIDSRSTGSEIILILRKLCSLISEGLDFDEVMSRVREYTKTTYTSFVLSSFDNLVKNGRMSRITGFIAHTMGLVGIGIASPEGTIDIKGVARGRKKAINVVLEDMKHRAVHVHEVIIDHCMNPEFAAMVRDAILEIWADAHIKLFRTRGLCSYYAEYGGLIIGYSSTPDK
ncbi:MAG: DegV family protein [Eubacteriaceae bacterium]|nr:DegV family protein [Eubacteriaceae bacterium]MBR2780982.1 DegV family protein [Eubacteriaceae bacterium]MCR4893741.1 DegV family protein [Eubacteriales bacterium]